MGKRCEMFMRFQLLPEMPRGSSLESGFRAVDPPHTGHGVPDNRQLWCQLGRRRSVPELTFGLAVKCPSRLPDAWRVRSDEAGAKSIRLYCQVAGYSADATPWYLR